ncbi:hypothetical protein [uncultured Tateyamaria sp.]|nr:hypothetical protein [uncultured Tateyamaria sp.]
MDWTNEEASKEYAWLKLMSAVKYDGYSDFRAGVRFLESLVTWLKQFDIKDRDFAYKLVKNRLVYISAAEMQQVIESFVPEVVTPYLRGVVAKELKLKPYEVWGSQLGAVAFKDRLRRCLFVGLSDGSRIDILRRSNAGILSQEQVLPMMNIGNEKWRGLNKDLIAEQGEGAKFEDVYLIDDFTASGTTFIRKSAGAWKGKLDKFEKMLGQARKDLRDKFPIADDYNLHIHHYVSTHQAQDALAARVSEAERDWKEKTFDSVSITEGTLLPKNLRMGLVPDGEDKMIAADILDASALSLCEKYYDHHLYLRLKVHCDEAGQSNMKYGYANCALPLILEHNTPNNALSLLWAETKGVNGHPMRPLFLRRDRHG